jgi:hypothetical protein
MRIFWLLFLLFYSIPVLFAQQKNEVLFQELAQACLQDVPSNIPQFVLDAPAQNAFLHLPLLSIWQRQGKHIFLPDSAYIAQTSSMPRLKYQVLTAEVTYESAPKKQILRTASLALRYSFQSAKGELLNSQECRKSVQDLVSKSQIANLESPQISITQGSLKSNNTSSKWLQTALLSAAVGITTYLLFAVRSK